MDYDYNVVMLYCIDGPAVTHDWDAFDDPKKTSKSMGVSQSENYGVRKAKATTIWANTFSRSMQTKQNSIFECQVLVTVLLKSVSGNHVVLVGFHLDGIGQDSY